MNINSEKEITAYFLKNKNYKKGEASKVIRKPREYSFIKLKGREF